MTERPVRLSRNTNNRERTHWLGDDGQPACWDSHQECARYKVEQLTAARDTQAARADAAEQRERALREAGEALWVELYDAAYGYADVHWKIQRDAAPVLTAWRAATVEAEPRAGQPAPPTARDDEGAER